MANAKTGLQTTDAGATQNKMFIDKITGEEVQVKSWQKLLFVNDDDKVSETEKDGYEPLLIDNILYQTGRPEDFRLDFQKAKCGFNSTSKDEWKDINDLRFVILAYNNLGDVAMYPHAVEDAQKNKSYVPKKRRTLQIFALVYEPYADKKNRVVCFNVPTWSAGHLIDLINKPNKIDELNRPVFLQRMLVSAKVKTEKTKAGASVYTATFDYTLLPLKEAKVYKEFAENAKFVNVDHLTELVALGEYNGIVGENGVLVGNSFIENQSSMLTEEQQIQNLQAIMVKRNIYNLPPLRLQATNQVQNEISAPQEETVPMISEGSES